VGISTQKMHARGPMGLRELTSYKWIVLGEGHIHVAGTGVTHAHTDAGPTSPNATPMLGTDGGPPRRLRSPGCSTTASSASRAPRSQSSTVETAQHSVGRVDLHFTNSKAYGR
jgi:hypothetical protein